MTDQAPQLFVFAGPNGAGKSTLSSSMVAPGTPIFDGDKELAILMNRFPGMESANLMEAVDEHIYQDWKAKVIQSRSDCAVETNFRTSELLKTVKQFKEHGYITKLVFFGLDSIDASVRRVNNRVSEGGHYVSPESVKINYENGLKNLGTYYNEFDTVTVFHNFIDKQKAFNSLHLMTISSGEIKREALMLPDWAKPFKEIVKKDLALKRSQKTTGQDFDGSIKQEPEKGSDPNTSRGPKL